VLSRVRLMLFLAVWMGVIAFGGCATGYRRRPLVDRQILQDLQNIRLEALQPSPAPDKVKPLAAGVSFDPSKGITVNEAVLVAEYLNPGIRAFRLRQGVAEGELVTARLIANPQLQVSLFDIQGFTKNLATMGVDSVLSWSPPRPGERNARIWKGQAHVEEVRSLISQQEWTLAIEVRKAYYTALAFQERDRLATASLKLQKRVLEFYEEKHKLGDASRLDLNLARLAYGDAAREQRTIVNEFGRALQELNRLLGLPPLYEVALRTSAADLEYYPIKADLTSLETLMLDQRPELQAAQQEYEQGEQAVRISRYERWPWFQLGPAFRREETEANHAASEIGPAIGMELPIFNFNRGAIMSAEAERDRLYQAFVSQMHESRAELNEAYRNLKAQEQLIKLFQSDIKPALEENRQLTETGLQWKDLNLLQILAAQDRVLRSQSDFVQEELEYWKSVFDLEKSLGAPITTGDRP
jgi:cobalt-zinc-cadmium efflux system outer membrane protein